MVCSNNQHIYSIGDISLNVRHIIAYLGLYFVMGNMIALMGKMNNRIVEIGHVLTYSGAQKHLYVFILLQFVMA